MTRISFSSGYLNSQEPANPWRLQVLCHFLFKLFVERTIIGNPLTIPDFLQHLVEFIEIRKEWGCYGYGVSAHSNLMNTCLGFYLFV